MARTFSFAVDDLKRGPIDTPAFHGYVTVCVAGHASAKRPERQRIRQLIPQEPEQTYERAGREIPELDPWKRENGGRVYLPLAADSSWQKFAFEYGGNVFISKHGTKAKGKELARLRWEGDRMLWKIGTGETPYYRDDRQCSVSKLEDLLAGDYTALEKRRPRLHRRSIRNTAKRRIVSGSFGRNEETPVNPDVAAERSESGCIDRWRIFG